jgi:hypothetical protein
LAGGPAGFTRSSTSSVLLWNASQRLFPDFAYGAFTLCGLTFQTVSLSVYQLKAPATPGRTLVWAFPLSLAATYGINVFLFSCGYLDVSVHHVRFHAPMNSVQDDWSSSSRVSTFRNLRINARLPASRSLSQAAASFVASRCQDIHHAPLVA